MDIVVDSIISRIYHLIMRAWQVVRDILCNDAPEGFMPEEVEYDSCTDTKDVLSYAWRSLKESM